MMEMFSATTYIERRKRLIQSVGSGIIFLIGNDDSSINFKDNWYHYRQDSTFLYFFGISLPGLAASINCDTGEEIIYGNELTMDDIVWTGPQPTIAQLAEKCGISKTFPLAKSQSLSLDKLHFLPTYRADNQHKMSQWFSIPMSEVNHKVSVSLIKAIAELRSVKSDEEINELHKAANITANMHMAAMQGAKPGMVEAEVVAKVHEQAIAGGGNLSFPVILSKHGQILHNHYHGNRIAEGDLLLCDSGAETSMGYAGDMTRTFPVSDKFTENQRAVYQIVLDAQETGIKALKPGITYKEVHLLACKTIASGLVELGLMKGDVDEIVSVGAHALFMPHGLGHMMGLDVHDMENFGEDYIGYDDEVKRESTFGLSALRLGKALKPGNVLTVEPGIYFIPELTDIWRAEKKHVEFINYDKLKAYRDFGGIRIEEDFVITEAGSQLLGSPLAKSVEDVEEVRAASLDVVNG